MSRRDPGRLDRRLFLGGAAAVGCLSLQDGAAGAPAQPNVRTLAPGPHLFLDDYLIEFSQGVERRVVQPQRDLPGPVVTGPEDRNFQPYFTVVRDPDTRRFRMWYGVPENSSQSHLALIESEDGIRWIRPHRVLADPDRVQFGCSVLDEGPAFPDRSKRYKWGWHDAGGLKVAASPDGIQWKLMAPGVVLRHDHDINSIYRDPIRKVYTAFVSTYTTGPTWKGQRRVTMQSTSLDLIQWEKPWFVITPVDGRPEDGKDQPETQFYCMSGLLARGNLLIGMVKVLHDDWKADDPPDPPDAYGVGYTTLAWSRDGRTWTRDRTPYLERDLAKSAWDHAHAWIDCQLPVGELVHLYYGGYKRGHKVERFTERQIGLLRIRQDRYVARAAGEAPGLLRTPTLAIQGRRLTANVDASGGELSARLLDADGKPVRGFDYEDCATVRADAVAAPLAWKRSLDSLKGRPVRLELRLRKARLFALGVEA